MGADTNKLLEHVGGRAIVSLVVEALCAGAGAGTSAGEGGDGDDPVHVVLGHQASDVRRALAGWPVGFVESERAGEGMGASLADGVRAVLAAAPVARAPHGLLVCVGDLPGLRAETVRRVRAAFAEAHAEGDSARTICVATHAGRSGHPVVFGADYYADLLALEGDRGGHRILEANREHVRRVEIDSDEIYRDVDTQEDLSRASRSRAG